MTDSIQPIDIHEKIMDYNKLHVRVLIRSQSLVRFDYLIYIIIVNAH